MLITTTDVPMRAPKMKNGVLQGQWETVDLSENEMASIFSVFSLKTNKKKRSNAYCLASFENNVRKKDHLVEVFGYSYDYDDGYTIAEFKEVVRDKGYVCFVYETYTSSAEKEKFRAVFPFSSPVPYTSVSNWRDSHCGFATALGLPITYDPTCYQPERLFFLPVRHPDDTKGKTFNLRGETVDVSFVEPVQYIRPLKEGETEETARTFSRQKRRSASSYRWGTG